MLFQAPTAKVSLEGVTSWHLLAKCPLSRAYSCQSLLPHPDKLGSLILNGNSGPAIPPPEPGSGTTEKPSHFSCPGPHPVPSLLSRAKASPRLETMTLYTISVIGRLLACPPPPTSTSEKEVGITIPTSVLQACLRPFPKRE